MEHSQDLVPPVTRTVLLNHNGPQECSNHSSPNSVSLKEKTLIIATSTEKHKSTVPRSSYTSETSYSIHTENNNIDDH